MAASSRCLRPSPMTDTWSRSAVNRLTASLTMEVVRPSLEYQSVSPPGFVVTGLEQPAVPTAARPSAPAAEVKNARRVSVIEDPPGETGCPVNGPVNVHKQRQE